MSWHISFQAFFDEFYAMPRSLSYFLLFALLWTGWGCSSSGHESIRVAAASSLRPFIDSIAAQYEEASGTSIDMIYGPSGSLATQIIQGAPYDLFLSASNGFANEVHERLPAASKPQLLFHSQLALVYAEPHPLGSGFFLPEMAHFSLPNPKVAPVGAAGMLWLDAHPLPESAQLIYASSAAGTLNHVLLGGAEVGITTAGLVAGAFPKDQIQVLEVEGPAYYAVELAQGSGGFVEFILDVLGGD